MNRLKQHNQLVDLQILENEANAEYKATMQAIWRLDNQIVPPNLHLCNATKHAICTFKAHLLSILTDIAEESQKSCGIC